MISLKTFAFWYCFVIIGIAGLYFIVRWQIKKELYDSFLAALVCAAGLAGCGIVISIGIILFNLLSKLNKVLGG